MNLQDAAEFFALRARVEALEHLVTELGLVEQYNTKNKTEDKK